MRNLGVLCFLFTFLNAASAATPHTVLSCSAPHLLQLGSRSAQVFANSESEKTLGVVLMAHGLNNPPSLMADLSQDLCHLGYDVVLVQLKGHDPAHPNTDIKTITADEWLTDAEYYLSFASDLAQMRKKPLHLVGYSLGALVFETYMNLNPGKFSVASAAYMAPAIGIKPYVHLVRILPFGDAHIIGSRNRADSRVNSGTSMAAYRALFDLRSRLLSTKLANFNVPHLAIFSRGDEMVDTLLTSEILRDDELKNWSMAEIEKSPEGLKHSYRHLCVTRAALGDVPYTNLVSEIANFLAADKSKIYQCVKLKALSPEAVKKSTALFKSTPRNRK